MTEPETQFELLVRKTNSITSRLWKQVLTAEERAVADAMCVSYAEAAAAKEKRLRGNTKLTDAIADSAAGVAIARLKK
jgi:hypothetical protein